MLSPNPKAFSAQKKVSFISVIIITILITASLLGELAIRAKGHYKKIDTDPPRGTALKEDLLSQVLKRC